MKPIRPELECDCWSCYRHAESLLVYNARAASAAGDEASVVAALEALNAHSARRRSKREPTRVGPERYFACGRIRCDAMQVGWLNEQCRNAGRSVDKPFCGRHIRDRIPSDGEIIS